MLDTRLATTVLAIKNRLNLAERLNLSGKRLSCAFAGAGLAAVTALGAVAVDATEPSTATVPAPGIVQEHQRHQVVKEQTRQILEGKVPARTTALTYGQDVSNHQPDHDWETSPAQFGIVKATEGVDFRDKTFARHWKELDEKGIVRGAYHFGHPKNDPIAEAEHFLSVVNSQPGKPGDLLVLDLETADGKSVAEVNAWAKAWLGHVKAKTGITPILYSGWSFADTYGEGLSEYPLWVAHYDRPKGQVDPPADWKTWVIHQYSDSPIDQNVSALTPDQLRTLGRPAA